jgi:hypothetical protein
MARIDIKSTGTTLDTGILQLENGVAMDATLRKVADQNNTVSPLLLSTALVQTTSTLKITTADNPYIDAEDNSGNNRFTVGRATSSQQVNVDFASNPTGSTTAVGAIRTYQDGVNLSEAMTFLEDGSVGIGTTAPVGILHIKKTAANTRLAIDGDAGFNRLISYRTNAVQRFGLYTNNTAESGSNVGSDFAIRAYSDAGTLLNTPVFIKRSTGNVGINTLTGTAKLQVVGSGSTSATTSLLVQNSSGTETFLIRDDAAVKIGAGSGNSVMRLDPATLSTPANITNLLTSNLTISGNPILNLQAGNANVGYVNIGGNITNSVAYTNDSRDFVLLNQNWNAVVGSSNLTRNAITLNNNINFTNSTGTNTARGLYINPTLTSVTNYFAIQSVFGGAYFNTSTPQASAVLQADSTTQGFLPPRMTNVERAAITTPAVGLMVYCTDVVEGLYIYKSTGWTFVI